MSYEGTLTLKTVEGTGLRFEARFGEWSYEIDSGPGASSASPMMALLGSLASCEAMDVLSILRKKRLQILGYEVSMRGERALEHPKRFTHIEIVHRLTGRGIPPAAVAEAIALSEQKYCSVRHSLRTDLEVVNRFEVIEG